MSEGTDLGELRQRVEDQLRKCGKLFGVKIYQISNPVREDKGITTVKDTKIRFTYQGVTTLNFGENDGSTHTWK